MSRHAYKPTKFFASTLLLTWASWFAAAYFSHRAGMESIEFLLLIPGLIAPMVIGLFMVFGSGSRDLKSDFWSRLTQIRRIDLRYVPVIVLLMPASVLAAIAVSLLFGASPAQFSLSDQFDIVGGQVLASLLISILAPTFEEIGWRGYGVDSLRQRFTLLKTSVLFAVLWGAWHVPLFFINNYYHNELWKMGGPYVVNFFLSILPMAFILNWVYYRNHRSIPAAILLHFMTVISAEAFATVESTKFIQTALLLIVAAGIVIYDRAFFEAQPEVESAPARSVATEGAMQS